MAKQALIQFRVEEELKQEVTEIYDALGIDLPTAFRMFMKRSKMVRGVPFETTLPENVTLKKSAAPEYVFDSERDSLFDSSERTGKASEDVL